MTRRLCTAVLVTCLVTAARSATAQTTTDPEIKFTMPLNLTQISSDISKVAVWCYITSQGVITTRDGRLQAQVELPVSGGQLVTTVTVSVAAPSASLSDPIGKPATYSCSLSGYSTSLQRWDLFNATSTVAAFRLSPTPQPITGSFTW